MTSYRILLSLRSKSKKLIFGRLPHPIYACVFSIVLSFNICISIIIHNNNNVISRLHVLEFDSNRKCMSVLVRDSKGQVRLLTKGAESSILPKCINAKTDPRFVSTVASHIDTFASRGLRTLAVATKTLSDKE